MFHIIIPLEQDSHSSKKIITYFSNQFKDKFDKACVVHDYCYASPWGRDRGGRDKCDLKFKELMDKICKGNLPCLATSGESKLYSLK